MSSMKIAIDAREMAGQGAGKGRYVAELVKALGEIDQTNTYFLYTLKHIEADLPANFHFIKIEGRRGFRQYWLGQDVKRKGCALLFAPTGYLPVLFSRVPTVLTVHDLALFVSPMAKPAFKTWLAERLLLGFASRKADRIIAISQNTKQDLRQVFNVPEEKIAVTLLGYDQSIYSSHADGNDRAVMRERKLTPGYLLFVGTLEPRKNIELLVRAYASLSPELKHAHQLVIAGQKGWNFQPIFDAVLEFKLQNRVKFLGRVDDDSLPSLYRQARVFLFPSHYEGFGLPPLEAMACGTPVIASNVSSLPEVVGKGGILLAPTDLTGFSSAMEDILTDEVLYQELRRKAVAQAAQFSWTKTAQATLAIFNQITR